jgi:hypothetical protein
MSDRAATEESQVGMIPGFPGTGWLVATSATTLKVPETEAIFARTSSVEFAQMDDIERVLQLYRVRDRQAVQSYLLAHQFLVRLIIDANYVLGEYFVAMDKDLYLIDDCEIPNRTTLHIGVQAGKRWRDARKIMRNFDRIWWYGTMDQAREKLSIDVD